MMIIRPALLLAMALSLVVGTTAPGTAFARDEVSDEARKEASEHFRRGVKLYRDADYVAALVEFKRAYELAPNYRVLYNLGQTSRQLKDYASALTAYRGYLEDGGDEVRGPRRKEVEDAIDDLLDRVGTLRITTNVKGAEVQIDDEVVGMTPLDRPVTVNIGKRRVAASLPGHVPASRVIEVAGRDELDVELSLVSLQKQGDDAPEPKPDRPPDSGGSGVPVAGIVALSITAACGITTGVLGGLALSAQGERDDALAAFPGDPQRIDSAVSKTDDFALATDVMLAVTGAGAVTTLVLFLVDPGGSGADTKKDPPEESSVSLTPSPGGLWLRGRF